jgi:hypothetical protein
MRIDRFVVGIALGLTVGSGIAWTVGSRRGRAAGHDEGAMESAERCDDVLARVRRTAEAETSSLRGEVDEAKSAEADCQRRLRWCK